MDERMYWVAWSRLSRMGGKRILALYEHFGSLSAAWEAPVQRLAEVSGLGPQLAPEAAAERRGRSPSEDWAFVNKPPVRVLTWLDEGYPAPLRHIPDPPPVLYVLGELPPWERAIAIVGTRQASPYGSRTARRLGAELAEVGAVVVSGVAAGIDRAAHEGALSVPEGLTVGVLGNGFHHVYPASNRDLYSAIRERGALVSEYPQDVKPLKGNFPLRNRLIAGLSQGVVVVEARRKSGSLLTVDHALEQGRSVFAVPGPIDAEGSEGPHELLRNGARLVGSPADVLDELGWAMVPRERPKADTPAEARVLAAIGKGARHLDELSAAASLGIAELGGLLVVMELKGLVRQCPGQRYEKA